MLTRMQCSAMVRALFNAFSMLLSGFWPATLSSRHNFTEQRVQMRIRLMLIAAAFCLLPHGVSEAGVGIRSSSSNAVPACITPGRLMTFVHARHPELPQRFRSIAHLYRKHGKAWRVRWDYAFFQMLLETNFLRFRRADGTPGDVRMSQNNFSGLGATGNGVAGDAYPDVSTGVLAQIHHLVAYSGERVAKPAGARTRLTQDVILRLSAPIARQRPITFHDLAGRWASDRRYGRSISAIAKKFHRRFCALEPSGETRKDRIVIPKPKRVRRDARRLAKIPGRSESDVWARLPGGSGLLPTRVPHVLLPSPPVIRARPYTGAGPYAALSHEAAPGTADDHVPRDRDAARAGKWAVPGLRPGGQRGN